MRWIAPALMLGTLAACSPAIPDSAAGVGFDNSLSAQRAREAAVTGSAIPAPDVVSEERLPPVATLPAQGQGPVGAPLSSTSLTSLPPASAAPQAAAPQQDAILNAAASLDATAANSGVAPVEASPSNPPPVQLNAPGFVIGIGITTFSFVALSLGLFWQGRRPAPPQPAEGVPHQDDIVL